MDINKNPSNIIQPLDIVHSESYLYFRRNEYPSPLSTKLVPNNVMAVVLKGIASLSARIILTFLVST